MLESFVFIKVTESSFLQHYRFIKKRLQHRCFFVNIANFLGTRIMKNICEKLFLKKLVASVLALLLNGDYLLTGYELITKKIDSCYLKKCLRFDIFLKLKTIHGCTYRNKSGVDESYIFQSLCSCKVGQTITL